MEKEKVRHAVPSKVVRTPVQREVIEKAEILREYREIMKRIELHKDFDEKWDDLWDRKRVLRSLLNSYNE